MTSRILGEMRPRCPPPLIIVTTLEQLLAALQTGHVFTTPGATP